MQEIKTLIFDLGGVIINLKNEQEWWQEDLFPHFQPEKLKELHTASFFQEFEIGKISVQDFIQQLKDIAIEENYTSEKVISYWNAILKEMPVYRIKLLKQLSKNYHLVLLSNTNDIHLDFIRNYMINVFRDDVLKSNFHSCYYSQEIGLRKPDREIYEYVLQKEDVQAENCIFFDDKNENLIEPGKLGIQTFLVDFNKLTASTLQHLVW